MIVKEERVMLRDNGLLSRFGNFFYLCKTFGPYKLTNTIPMQSSTSICSTFQRKEVSLKTGMIFLMLVRCIVFKYLFGLCNPFISLNRIPLKHENSHQEQ
jgi:hypothetical protein